MIELILSFGPSFIIQGNIENLNKCIVSGKIVAVDVTEENCYNLNILIEGIEGKYSLHGIGDFKENSCRDNKIYDVYETYWGTHKSVLPKVGDNVDFLIDKDTYRIVSDKKLSNGEYKVGHEYITYYSKNNFEVCGPNTGEDTEIQSKMRSIHSYLNELSYNKPRTAKKLSSALENLDLSILPQETNILVLYAREILKMLVGSL